MKPSILRLLTILSALFILAPIIPAQAQSFGRTTVGTIPSGGLRADFKRGSKFTLTEQGTITQLCAYLDGGGGVSATQSIRLALYRDSGGTPGIKVGETAVRSISAGAAASWTCLDTAYLVLDPGSYWIMLHSGGTAGVARFYSDGPANWYGNADAFADGASDPFGSGDAGTGTLSLYAAYSTADGIVNAGRTTVGSTPSGGLRADYKRGSKFHLSGYGRTLALSAYMDGLGGGTGSQDVTFIIYDSSQGTPSSRTPFKATVTIPAGMKPQWITVPIPPYTFGWAPTLPPEADFWFVIHSGSNAGIARYYADGAGNWCGHADAYVDGPDLSFGSCDAGNGTISAFLSFEPGEFTLSTFGNSESFSSATPSGGMTANYIRGSRFAVTQDRAVLKSIYTYLDGQGGGTGTQQVQVLVYDDSPGHKLMAQSDVQKFTAGSAPRWAIFTPREPVLLPPGNYYMMFFTSGNAGVVRNYATPTPNWLGIAANFASGPPAILDPPPVDAVTGSVTLYIYAELEVPVSQ